MNAPYFIFWTIVMAGLALLIRHYGRQIVALLREIRDLRERNGVWRHEGRDW